MILNSKLCSAALVFLLSLVLTGCSAGEKDGPVAEGGFPDFQLKTLEGESRSLEDYLNEVTLVNFFFPTCGPCNAEFPHLQDLYDKYRDQGFSMVAINLIADQDELVPAWVKSNGYSVPTLIGGDTGNLIETYEVMGTPTSFLLDRDGRVIQKYRGYQPGNEVRMENAIRQQLDLN